jgi:hypothetical protein
MATSSKPGNISSFKSSFVTDLARPNRFDVVMPIPPVIDPEATARLLSYRCENAQLPGRTFSTTEQKTYGPIEKFPYLTGYTDLDLTFIVSDDMIEKYVFDTWLEAINPTATNDFAYKSDYSTTITINQYNLMGEKTYSADFIEAYPISMNQMDLDWSADGYHKITVTFAYTRWFNRTESPETALSWYEY